MPAEATQSRQDRFSGIGVPSRIRPTSNLLLVELLSPSPIAGLFIPSPAFGIKTSQDQRGHRGKVLAVGPGKRTKKSRTLIPMSVSVGDIVWFGEFDFKRWTENGVTTMLISEQDVCGVEEP